MVYQKIIKLFYNNMKLLFLIFIFNFQSNYDISPKDLNQIFNQQLSENRAKSVIKTLVALYPELAGSLDYQGKGFSQLRYKGDQEKVHQLNRRVEVRFL